MKSIFFKSFFNDWKKMSNVYLIFFSNTHVEKMTFCAWKKNEQNERFLDCLSKSVEKWNISQHFWKSIERGVEKCNVFQHFEKQSRYNISQQF